MVGVGILPNVELAEAAGLACDDGIVVDEHCVTSDPAVLAVGDCTNTPAPVTTGGCGWSRCRTLWPRRAPRRLP